MKNLEFQKKDKIKCLLWCSRHCCLCGKACGIDIEVAHLDPGKKDIDNAIPLCYDCHAKIGHYNLKHPKGNNYSIDELRKRREQVYEEYTRHLVPPIHFEMTQILPGGTKRSFPDIGFNIMHMGDSLPIKVLIRLELFLKRNKLNSPGGHYSGKKCWNLNPRLGYNGHFFAPAGVIQKTGRFEIKVHAIIIDQYERYHELLPVSWVYKRNGNSWYAEP